jgi:hypothetical protein
VSRGTRILAAAAAACLTAAVVGASPDAGQAKHCRTCLVGGSLTLAVQATPESDAPSVDVVATGGVSSKQRLCRKAGSVELWRRLTDGSPDRDIGVPKSSPPGTYRSEAVFNIDDGNGFGNALIRYPPGSTVEFWAVRPKFKTSSGIIGSPILKCQQLESPHVFVPVPNPPAT